MSSQRAPVVIVGAGHAGGSLAAMLRQYGVQGRITLLSEESVPPYQRPPLSKACLMGEVDATSLLLKPEHFYTEREIELRLGARVAQIDRIHRKVTLQDGVSLSYDHLILATGSRPVVPSIEGSHLAGVLYLRTLPDAHALKSYMRLGKKLVILGGGYIGLEVAASARAVGLEVIVLERESRLLARVACATLSTFLRDYHEKRGVKFELGATAVRLLQAGGHVRGVRLADDRQIDCDAVLVCVGAQPNDELAAQAGLRTERGIVVDGHSRTSDPHVFAIGDVALRTSPLQARTFRLESVANALDQAKQVASVIAGRPVPASEVPCQWSDQYDLKLQIVGRALDADDIAIRGEPASGKFALFHLKGAQVQSVEAVNAPLEFMTGRQLIASRKPVDKSALCDVSVSLKQIAA
jgi:3-phenylpropionate/trans-cinnamate dioxygenase ferredoxin reductase subunit